MKKLFVYFFSVVMMAALTACGNEVIEGSEKLAGTESIAMSADMKTGTGHDVPEQKTDSTEAADTVTDINEEEDKMNNTMKITAGDIILYQGNSLVIYYDTNSWNFTRIGKINDVTQAQLLEAFGDGDVTVTFSLD